MYSIGVLFYSGACDSKSDVGREREMLFVVFSLFRVTLMLFIFNTGGNFLLSFMACHFVKSTFNCALCLDPDIFIASLFVDHQRFLMGRQLLLYCSVNDISYFPDNMETPLIVTVGFHWKCMLFC